jgi:hypothetical protein
MLREEVGLRNLGAYRFITSCGWTLALRRQRNLTATAPEDARRRQKTRGKTFLSLLLASLGAVAVQILPTRADVMSRKTSALSTQKRACTQPSGPSSAVTLSPGWQAMMPVSRPVVTMSPASSLRP